MSKIKRLGSKELDAARRRAHKGGWLIERLGSGHVRWVSPSGRIVITSATPNGSGVRCDLVRLKRAGL